MEKLNTTKPESSPREGWEDAFQQMRDNEDDKLLIDDVFEDEVLNKNIMIEN